jgi:hypothetical protein
MLLLIFNKFLASFIDHDMFRNFKKKFNILRIMGDEALVGNSEILKHLWVYQIIEFPYRIWIYEREYLEELETKITRSTFQ